MFICIKTPGHGQLVVAVHAGDALSRDFCLGQGGQEQAGQNGDDCNDNEKFYQRKRLFSNVFYVQLGWVKDWVTV